MYHYFRQKSLKLGQDSDILPQDLQKTYGVVFGAGYIQDGTYKSYKDGEVTFNSASMNISKGQGGAAAIQDSNPVMAEFETNFMRKVCEAYKSGRIRKRTKVPVSQIME